MGKTFQEQLLQLGLVDKKKAKAVKKQKHQNLKQKAGKKKAAEKTQVIDENVLLAREAEAKKKAKAKKLNLEREAKLQKRAEDARVKQLVEQNKVEKDPKGLAYRFNYSGKIQRVFVRKEVADQLSCGQLAIVKLGEQFELIPKDTARKIQSINAQFYVYLVELSGTKNKGTDDTGDQDDPYAEYKIPDDIVW